MSIRPLLLALGGLFWAFSHAPPRCDAGTPPDVGATSNVAADDLASSDEAEPTACYTLVAPGSAWRQLDPAELRSLAPDALAGLAGPRGVRVFLHAGPNVHPELQTSLDEVLRAQQLEQSAVAFVEETEIGGHQALRGMINGRREGVWIRFHALVFREGPDLYRLTGWGRSETVPADGSTFEEACAGLRRLEGMTLDVLPRGGVAPDADGPGWRVRGGTYVDGALGFVLDPRGPWRVALGRELGPLARLTHVGLIDEQHDALFAVAVERNHGKDFAREEQLRRAALGDSFASGVLSISAAGRKVDLRLATVPGAVGTNDVTRQLAVGVLNEGDLTVLFVARHPAATAVNMVEPLQQALASLRVLPESQRQALAEQLASAPVALDAVGRGWCLRERTFTDFANGVRWRAPAGFWLVEGGDGGAASEEGVLARIQERQSGLRGTLSARPTRGLDNKAWHAAQVARRLMPRADGEPDITIELGDCTGSLSWGDLADDSGWRGVVATCVRGDRGFELVLRGPPEVLGGASGTALSAVGALEVAATSIAPTEMLQGSYVDLRLGFSLTSPDPSWSYKESKLDRFGPQAAAADGVVAGFDGGGGRGVYASAAWTAAAKDASDATPDSLLPSTLRSMADLPDREPDENIDATLRGRPSRLLTWNERGRRIEVALFTRGCTVFAVCAASVAGDPEPRQWLAGFQLLD
jgi:hypothetical protein